MTQLLNQPTTINSIFDEFLKDFYYQEIDGPRAERTGFFDGSMSDEEIAYHFRAGIELELYEFNKKPENPDDDDWNAIRCRFISIGALAAAFSDFDSVVEERSNQDRQWGGPDHDDAHTLDEFGSLIERQMNFITGKLTVPEFKERYTKICALAVAAVLSMDRRHRAFRPSTAFV